MACISSHAQEEVSVHAAGSLRAALTDVAGELQSASPPMTLKLAFGASGLLRDRLLGGEPSQVFVSANTEHPEALAKAGRSDVPVAFARNALCALVRPGLDVTSANLVDHLMRRDIRVGTSTPRADPSGDYAFEMFDRIEATGAAGPGSAAALKARALQLTGGPGSPPPPTGRSVYGMLVSEGQADIFITYCTNATLARREQPALQVIDVPVRINVSARYALAVIRPATAGASRFVEFLLGARGQEILRRHGFQGAR